MNAGADQWLVSYPKYKKGGAVSKEIKEACKYGNNKLLAVITKKETNCSKIM